PRNFARAFTSETGVTPAKAVERMRLETARTAIETSHLPLERIAETAGFGDPGRMRRAFLRTLGQPPQAFRAAAEHRELHSGRPSSGSAGLRAVPVHKRTKANERT
ncbi:helix-turn-helix domain-containing protein, partial [Mesorhizobium sp. M7A.F.Ca.CA.001.13.2.1]